LRVLFSWMSFSIDEWFVVALGFLFDLASYSRVERRRRHDARA